MYVKKRVHTLCTPEASYICRLHGFFLPWAEIDLESAEILINVGREEPSWWVWVSDDMVLGTEEQSGLDDENYVIVREEHVVDGVANFIARCVVSNPKVQVCIDKHYPA